MSVHLYAGDASVMRIASLTSRCVGPSGSPPFSRPNQIRPRLRDWAHR
ncbi:MAG TPA: hypothetical protein VHV74_10540 [Pseudonocardiaceae bacterium]|nr:hypothetical protein [Pseudonocardiaceae bacterium]